jgi:transcriptional regulator with XRE-family HTH domain
MKIGKNLIFLRKNKNLTQNDIAKILNISRQAYCRYENDQREPSLEILCLLADFYDESVDSILGREKF